MAVIINSLLIRRYTDKVEIIQTYFNLPGNTVIKLTYTPPAGYVYVNLAVITGYMPAGMGDATVYFDGTLYFSSAGGGVTGGWAFDKMHEQLPNYAKHNADFIVNNSDNVMHTIDIGVVGVLIPDHSFEKFLIDANDFGSKSREEEVIRLLEDINSKLSR